MKADDQFSLSELLLDRQIFDVDGEAVGKVDDVEVTPAVEGGPPVITAILCGPMAFGPRVGGRVGRWWSAIGRRLRPDDDPHPNRIPLHQVDHVDRREMRLIVSRNQLDADRLRDWVRDHVIAPIPGSSR